MLALINFPYQVAVLGEELTVEERNLLSVAYKNVIGALRCVYLLNYCDILLHYSDSDCCYFF